MSPKEIAALVMQMKPPLELRNRSAELQWQLEEAATIAMKVAMDEIMKPIKKVI